jgi:hypothetical protein
MVGLDLFIEFVLAGRSHPWLPIKKADVVEHPEVFGHVGSLVNWPPSTAGSPFI